MATSLAAYITRLRIEREWSIATLSKLSGVSSGSIQKIENGTTTSPRFDIVIGLSKAFKVPIVKFAAALEGRDPDTIQDEDVPALESILDTVVAEAKARLHRRVHPPKDATR